MNKEIIYKGWVDLFSNNSESKSWVKLQVKKPWKRKFIILFCLAGNAENPRLGSYDKEENLLCLGEPKKSILLYPSYRINKRYDFKGKPYVLEISTDKEQWCISSDESVEIIDKWATQIQMQSKLSRVISSCIYLVDGASNEDMKRIGASQEKCILHLNKWGIVLALQRCRSILAMWPIKTIRNYECGEHREFSIEAGRRSPMGEGNYLFFTTVGQDGQIFKTLDRFIVNALHKKACVPQQSDTSKETTADIDYNQAYEQLRQSALGIGNNNPVNHGFLRLSPPQRPSEINQPPEYNYIDEQVCSSNSNISSSARPCIEVQNGMYFHNTMNSNYSYDKLEHNQDISRSLSSNYDNIDENSICGTSPTISTYDKLNKSDTLKNVSAMYTPINKNKQSIEMVQYQCASPTDSEVLYDNASLHQSDSIGSSSHLSIGNGGSRNLLSQHSIQEIADHFIYQIPSSLPSTNEVEKVGNESDCSEYDIPKELYKNISIDTDDAKEYDDPI